MLDEAKDLLRLFPGLYRDFDDPVNEPDVLRSYDGNDLMGIYLAVFDLFEELVDKGDEVQARRLLAYAKEKVKEDRKNWPSDLSTAIIIGVFENFGHNTNLWKNLNRWFTVEEYLEFREAFEYLLDPDDKILVSSLYFKKTAHHGAAPDADNGRR